MTCLSWLKGLWIMMQMLILLKLLYNCEIIEMQIWWSNKAGKACIDKQLQIGGGIKLKISHSTIQFCDAFRMSHIQIKRLYLNVYLPAINIQSQCEFDSIQINAIVAFPNHRSVRFEQRFGSGGGRIRRWRRHRQYRLISGQQWQTGHIGGQLPGLQTGDFQPGRCRRRNRLTQANPGHRQNQVSKLFKVPFSFSS